MLRAVAVSIVVAVLGVLYIIANPQDPNVKGFGWALVIIGGVLAAAFTALWARDQTKGPTAGKRGGDDGRKGRKRGA